MSIDPKVRAQLELLAARAQLPAAVRDQVLTRLHAGAVEHGDASLTRPLVELYEEVLQEPLDVVGWSALIAMRLPGDQREAHRRLLRACRAATVAYLELEASLRAVLHAQEQTDAA